ncbi:hypothetical protein LCGC14_3054580 [marine sediment metagenome]|uniref:Uncharacterized protein n=1 Tax=marine sediment metagenome TaxID=412755 RepID=A0A0F8WL80_9ZZZZ
MKNKIAYLVTTERRVYMCSPYTSTDFYALEYYLDTKKNIERFLEEINPKEVYTHLAILFIRELKG